MTLDELARKHGADRSRDHHGYCDIYARYFEPLRNDPVMLLELGFGGYDYPDRGGAGAKMWADYFLNGQIITVDVYFKNNLGHPRITFSQGSQSDASFLDSVMSGHPIRHSGLDIIIDDGSHRSEDCTRSFDILFPYLKPGGIYVVEDAQTSYWPDHGYGGGWHPDTTLNYFKRLTDHLNAEHNGLTPRSDIQAIHFWKQQVFILKTK